MSLRANEARLDRRRFLAASGRATACALLGITPGISSSAVTSPGESYEGMHDSAAWRSAALERIERDRKQAFIVDIADATGKAVEGTAIELELVRHRFGFGGALKLSRLFDDEHPAELRARYKELAGRLFHKTVSLNAFKWKYVDNNLRFLDPFLSWCQDNNLPVRGHTLVWPRFRRAPEFVAELSNRPDELRAAIQAHIRRMVGAYRSRIVEWDVLNEPYTEHEYMDILGEDVVSEWFATVREEDPDVIRYVNDFGVLTRPARRHQDFYFDYIGKLLDSGTALQGIGFQAHNPSRFPLESPENVLQTLDRFAVYGLDLQITEFDVERTDRDVQARYTTDFLIAVFSHPATVGLLTWTPFEYGDALVSKPEAAFYDQQLRRRPNGEVWDQLVNGEWRTRESGGTSPAGRFDFRGFPGTYRVRVRAGSTTHVTKAEFLSDKNEVTITLT